VAVCSFWGTITLLARTLDLPAVAIVFARVWIAAAGLGALVATGRVPGPRLFSYKAGTVARAGGLLALHWTTMFAAYRRAPADTVVFLVFLAPVGVAALAPRLLGERTHPRTVAALALAVAGLALVAGPSRPSGPGVALALVSAAAFVALVLTSKPLAQVYGGLRLNLMEMAVAGVALLPFAATVHWGRPHAEWGWLVVLGLVHTAVGITLYLAALADVPATHVGILGYFEPVAVVVFAWLVLGERPRPATLAGGLLIVAAGTLLLCSSATSSSLTSSSPSAAPSS
jgi:drug/metabolite transporter (DMT)-like permease